MFTKARSALRVLISAGSTGATGEDIFGADTWAGNNWTGGFIRLLKAEGVVTTAGFGQSSHGRKPLMLVATPSLGALLHDDEALAQKLWGHRAEYQPGADPAEPLLFPVVEKDGSTEEGSPSAAPDTDETLQAVLKLSAATLENLVYMREQMAALTRAVAELQKMWSA
jgi:hypothetical protein